MYNFIELHWQRLSKFVQCFHIVSQFSLVNSDMQIQAADQLNHLDSTDNTLREWRELESPKLQYHINCVAP